MPKKKKKGNKGNTQKTLEDFCKATKAQKEEFINALEKALNFDPKKK